jgi:hypothetical protein
MNDANDVCKFIPATKNHYESKVKKNLKPIKNVNLLLSPSASQQYITQNIYPNINTIAQLDCTVFPLCAEVC